MSAPSSSSYDGAYLLTSTAAASSEKGPFLSNGKVGMTLAHDGMDSIDCFVTGQFAPKSSLYSNNLVDSFRISRLRLFGLSPPPSSEMVTTTTNPSVALAMDTGIATVAYDLLMGTNNTLMAHVEHDIYAHRTYPFVFIQTLRVTFSQACLDTLAAQSSTKGFEASIFHEVIAPPQILNPKYSSNTLALPSRQSVSMMCGRGGIAEQNRGSEQEVVMASAYIFGAAHAQNAGYNIDLADRSRAFNRIDLNLDSLVAGQALKIHVITVAMTTYDIPDPAEEAQRMLLNMLTRSTALAQATPGADAVSAIRQAHVNAWMHTWTTNILLEAKAGISQEDADKVQLIRKGLRIALYNIFSCTRPGINQELNPFNISVVDRDGSIMYDGDLFFIPALLLLDPQLARNLLDQRFKHISNAQQLAAAYGGSGTKYPYSTDTLGYPNALYWDTTSPLAVFNTPLVGISAWNYYRVAKDFAWLSSIGYPILRNVADYIVSIAQHIVGTSEYTLRNVQGPAGKVGDDNVFTNYLAATALKYAIEASYELNMPARNTWSVVYSGLRVPTLWTPTAGNVPKFDAAFTSASKVTIAEPLLLLMPYYDTLYYLLDDSRGPSTIAACADFYKDCIDPSYPDHPYNTMARAVIAACAAQSLPPDEAAAQLNTFQDLLVGFLQKYMSGPWGNLSSRPELQRNDVTMSAMLVVTILMGPLGYRIRGGVTETRFYYQDLRIDNYESARLPDAWDYVQVRSIGEVVAANIMNVNP